MLLTPPPPENSSFLKSTQLYCFGFFCFFLNGVATSLPIGLHLERKQGDSVNKRAAAWPHSGSGRTGQTGSSAQSQQTDGGISLRRHPIPTAFRLDGRDPAMHISSKRTHLASMEAQKHIDANTPRAPPPPHTHTQTCRSKINEDKINYYQLVI